MWGWQSPSSDYSDLAHSGWAGDGAERRANVDPYLSTQTRLLTGTSPGAGGKGTRRRRLSRPWPGKSWASESIGRRPGERWGEAQDMSTTGTGADPAGSHDTRPEFRIRDAVLRTKQARRSPRPTVGSRALLHLVHSNVMEPRKA